MNQFFAVGAKTRGTATTALLGAVAGTVGVWALDRVDWLMWNREDPRARAQTIRVRPGGEPPSHALITKVEEFTGSNLTERQHNIAGNTTHYSIGMAPAAGYALIRAKLPGNEVSRGALFGLSLFLVQDEALNSLTGLGAKPGAYPWQAHARGLIAHVVYGLTTEFILSMMDRRKAKPHTPAL